MLNKTLVGLVFFSQFLKLPINTFNKMSSRQKPISSIVQPKSDRKAMSKHIRMGNN